MSQRRFVSNGLATRFQKDVRPRRRRDLLAGVGVPYTREAVERCRSQPSAIRTEGNTVHHVGMFEFDQAPHGGQVQDASHQGTSNNRDPLTIWTEVNSRVKAGKIKALSDRLA
jgi:hypothetical protein